MRFGNLRRYFIIGKRKQRIKRSHRPRMEQRDVFFTHFKFGILRFLSRRSRRRCAEAYGIFFAVDFGYNGTLVFVEYGRVLGNHTFHYTEKETISKRKGLLLRRPLSIITLVQLI